MPPQELQIIVSAVNQMGPVVEQISQGIQRLLAVQQQALSALTTMTGQLGQFATGQARVTQATTQATTAVTQQTASLNQLLGISRSVSTDFTHLGRAGAEVSKAFTQNRMDMGVLARSGKEVNGSLAEMRESAQNTGGSFEVLGMSIEKLGKRIREALVFFVAFRIFWEAWNFITDRMRDLFDLEQQLKRVQSATIFDPSGMANLNDLTVVMTSNMTRFGTSVKETADAMFELVSAGLPFAQMQAGLPTVLGLVNAGVSDIGNASRAVSAIFKTWDTDFERIGDVIAFVLNQSQVEIGGFITALQRTAATAKFSGLTFEQTAISVAVLNDAMIFGGNAGRALRRGLEQIAQETDFLEKLGVMVDRTQNMGDQFDSIVIQLGKLQREGKISVGQLAEMFEHFGIQGQQAISALIRFSERYAELEAMLRTGVVKGSLDEIVNIRMDNVIDQFKRFTAAVTALIVKLGELFGMMESSSFADRMRSWANILTFGLGEGSNLSFLQDRIKQIRDLEKTIGGLQDRVRNLSRLPYNDPLVSKDIASVNTELNDTLERQRELIEEVRKRFTALGPDARKEVQGIVDRVLSLHQVTKEIAASPTPSKTAPFVKDYDVIVKEVRAQVALLEAHAALRKEQAKLLETSGRESDFQKSLQMQREAVVTLDAGMQKLLPQLHKGTQEQLQLAASSVKNKIEIAGLNKELLQFGSQFQASERAIVSMKEALSQRVFHATSEDTKQFAKNLHLAVFEEQQFLEWYRKIAQEQKLNPNPDDPQHGYDYRKAFMAGAGPDTEGHWPSEFKRLGNARLILDGINTVTGELAGNVDKTIQGINDLAISLDTLHIPAEAAEKFGVTLLGLQKPVETLSKEMEELEKKYGKVGAAADKSAELIDKRYQRALTAALQAIELQEKLRRAEGLFDADAEAEFTRQKIALWEAEATRLRERVALMESLHSEREQDVALLEQYREQLFRAESQVADLNTTSGDFWTAFSRGAQTALSEMSRGFKETFGEAKSLIMELQKSISDVLFDSITRGFDNATDGLKRFGEAILRYFTNEMSKSVIRSISGWLRGVLSGGSQGVTAGQGGGLFGMLGNFSGLLGVGGNNPAASAAGGGGMFGNLFGWLGSLLGMGGGAMPGGMASAGGMASGVGTAGAMGGMGSIMGMFSTAMISAGIGKMLGNLIFGKSGGTGAAIGAGIGSLFGGVGALVGGLGGGLLGWLFGKTPKAKLRANILPFDLDELTSGGLRDLDTAVRGTRVGAIGVNVRGNVYKSSKEHKLEEKFARALNDLFVDMVRGIEKIIPQLPKTVGVELDAALNALADEGLVFEKWSKSGSKAKKKLKAHLRDLPNQMIESVVEELGFGKLDLKKMGGGDAAKGFDSLMGALGGLSEVMERVGGSTGSFSGTLEQFTDKSIEFFEQFRRGGETFAETVERVNQGFAQLFGVIDQLTLDIGMSATGSFKELVDAYQQTAKKMTEASDALTVAIESGASPDEVAAAAQAVRDASEVSLSVLQSIHTRLQSITEALITGVNLYVDLEARIQALGGAATSLDAILSDIIGIADVADGWSRLEVGDVLDSWTDRVPAFVDATMNVGARISLLEAALRAVGGNFSTFTAALPRLAAAFNAVMASIRNTTNNAEAVTQLQALAQAVINGAQAIYQGIADAANKAREAAQKASEARIEALNKERDLIEETYNKQREALNAALERAREWKSVLDSVKSQLADLNMLLAPTNPQGSFNDLLAQFRRAFADFQRNPTAEAARLVQDLARQVLQLAQGVPGMDLPSAAFQALAKEIEAALKAIADVAAKQPDEAQLLAQLKQLDEERNTKLKAIDDRIAAEQASLRAQLDAISATEQAQVAFVNAQQAEALTQIREELARRLEALKREEEEARKILQQITGSLSFEQFIAQKQSESVDMLKDIRNVLRDYLGRLLEGLHLEVPAMAAGGIVMPQRGGTIVRLAEAGYPEMVTPLRGGSTGAGGGKTVVNINLAIHADKDTDGQKVGRETIQTIKEAILYGELRQPIQKIAGWQ